MNDYKSEETISSENQNYEVKKNRKLDIFAFILCIVIAFAIWVFAVNNDTPVQDQSQPSSVAEEETVFPAQLVNQ